MKTFIHDNGGEFNHDNFPNAFYADKNPGEYTVKIYRKGAQVRELKFAIGASENSSLPAMPSWSFSPGTK